MPDDDSRSQSAQPQHTVVPIEPLYSMLQDAPLSAVEYLHRELSAMATEEALNEILPALGISRQKAIEQAWYVLCQRRQR